MKTTLFLFLILTTSAFAQVGIGTTDPKGALDISSSTLGLVLPRVTQLESVTNNNAGLAEAGTIVYDISRNKTCFRISSTWICLDNNASLVVESVGPAPPPPVNNRAAETQRISTTQSENREEK